MLSNHAAAALKSESSSRDWKKFWDKWPGSPPIRNRILIGSFLLLLLILSAYRIFTFVPLPLDSPGTARPALYALFTWFVGHYANRAQAQQAWAGLCLASLAIPVALALSAYFSSHSIVRLPVWLRKVACSRLLFFGGIATCLAVCRFPSLLFAGLNPDEALFLVAAHKSFRDPVFFRAVDCGTSGPLNVYPLMLPALFGISPDYASTRLIALLTVLAGTYWVYRSFALLVDDAVARVAVLPAAGAFAALKGFDFQHYSSEHVSFVLLALAIFVCVRIFRDPQPHASRLVGLGILTSAAFFAKMQAVPIIASVSLVAVAYVHASGYARRNWRPSVLFVAGLVPLFALNAAVCALTGVWKDFWIEYIAANYQYAQSYGALAAEVSRFGDYVLESTEIRLLVVTLLSILAAYAYQVVSGKALADLSLFLRLAVVSGVVSLGATALLRPDGSGFAVSAGVIGMAVLPGAFLLLCRSKDSSSAPVRWLGFLSAAVLASSIISVYAAHHSFPHYLLLLIFPIAIAMGWPVAAACWEEKAGGGCSALPFVLLFATLILVRQLSEAASPGLITFDKLTPGIRAPEGLVIDSLTQPSDGIAVWGWDFRPYLSAGRVTATKDITTVRLFSGPVEVRTYYREAYLRAMRRHPPKLFIDATDSSYGAFADRQNYGFETVPEVKAFVHSNYEHFLDAYGKAFYIRRNLRPGAAAVIAKLNKRLYRIVSRLSGKSLDLANGAATIGNGAQIQQRDQTGNTTEQWEFVPVDETYYKIISKRSGKVLDVVGGPDGFANGTRVQQWDYVGGANQQWELVHVDGKYYEIVSKLSGKLLEVEGVPSANGIRIWEHTGGWNQQWQLLPVQQ